MAGFEFHPTPLPINKIKHLPMQKSEKYGGISANPQPDATGKSEAGGTGWQGDI